MARRSFTRRRLGVGGAVVFPIYASSAGRSLGEGGNALTPKAFASRRFNVAKPTFRVISRRISCSTSVKGQTNQRHLMKTKILRNIFNIFISVSVLFTLTGLLTAATSDGILDFGDTPLCHSHPTFITFDPPGSTFTCCPAASTRAE